MGASLVTGFAGTPHVTARQDGLRNVGFYGHGSYLLPTQERLAAELLTANQVSIATGDVLMQGRHVSCEDPTFLDITSGTVGFSRIDLVALRYEKDPTSGLESVSWRVIEGQNSLGEPAEPAYERGDITEGVDLVAELPVYRIRIDGLAPGKPELLLQCPEQGLGEMVFPLSLAYGGTGAKSAKEATYNLTSGMNALGYGSDSNVIGDASWIVGAYQTPSAGNGMLAKWPASQVRDYISKTHVQKSGDTMTGNLTIKTGSDTSLRIENSGIDSPWRIHVYGSNSHQSTFGIYDVNSTRHPLYISEATGQVSFGVPDLALKSLGLPKVFRGTVSRAVRTGSSTYGSHSNVAAFTNAQLAAITGHNYSHGNDFVFLISQNTGTNATWAALLPCVYDSSSGTLVAMTSYETTGTAYFGYIIFTFTF